MTKIIAGNWKMNGTLREVRDLTAELITLSQNQKTSATVILCPSHPYLGLVSLKLMDSDIKLGAQDCSNAAKGAYTGQVSAVMLKDLSCAYVILGHSERRTLLKETAELIAEKVQRAVETGLVPILCVGENLQEREEGQAREVVLSQAKDSFKTSCLIAYEPVWAIGSGKVPTKNQIAEIHQALAETYPGVPLLYGGSVKSSNAAEILSIPHVDGLLVGGASLQASEFWSIVQAAH